MSMRNKYLVTAFFAFFMLTLTHRGDAQSSAMRGFGQSSMFLGPHFGFGYYGGGLDLGGNFEVAVTEPGKAGPGIIAVAARVDYESFTDWALTSFSAIGNYHFALENKQWDLYAGLGLG